MERPFETATVYAWLMMLGGVATLLIAVPRAHRIRTFNSTAVEVVATVLDGRAGPRRTSVLTAR
ncbi:MAG: hypothetical protein AB8G96_06370 [Phycisphaerales bacterium]